MNNTAQIRKWLKYRTDGGAMMYAVFIMAVLTSICALIIGLNYYRNFANREALHLHLGRVNADNGIILMLAEPELFVYDKTQQLSLFGKGNDSVSLRREQWGLYDLLISESKVRNNIISRIVFAGNIAASDKPAALYIAPSVISLNIAGSTVIRGKALVPDAAISTTAVNGQSFTGSLTGCDIQNSSAFPQPHPEWEKLKTENILNRMLKMKAAPCSGNLTLTEANSFRQDAKVFVNTQEIFIGNADIKGKIAIISSRRIIVSNCAKLENVLLIAPTIYFEKGFKGSLQAIARDSIITGEHCEFQYPSVLSIYTTNHEDKPAKIVLAQGSILNGIALCISENSPMNRSFMIILEHGSTVNGQVICNDIVQISGCINGALVTKKTLAITASGTFENTIIDAVIDAEALPESYAGIDIFNKTTTKEIIKCVH